jgi:hypothetical protein
MWAAVGSAATALQPCPSGEGEHAGAAWWWRQPSVAPFILSDYGMWEMLTLTSDVAFFFL